MTHPQVRYLDLVDYLLIAESVLGIPADAIGRFDRITLADSALAAPAAGFAGVDAYPDLPTKVAVLLWHLARNHPLPDGNKRTAYIAAVRFAWINGYDLVVTDSDPDETETVVNGAAAGSISEADLRDWIVVRLVPRTG